MHHCEEFRERITERIIDGEDLTAQAESQRELLICSACSEFYAESCEMIDALSSVDLGLAENEWSAMDQRLRRELHRLGESPRRHWRLLRLQLAAAAALLLIMVSVYRLPMPSSSTTPQAEYVERPVPLDPVTVDFLEQSELLLRNVMKIAPDDTEDLADAKKVANEQLAGIDQRREAAVEVPPVLHVIDTYETVLRDIRNVDERSSADDIIDIKNRIQSNALIANMKAFQPRVSTVGLSLR